MTFYEKAQQMKQLDTELYEHVPAYLQKFDAMILQASLDRLAYEGLETTFRARLQRYMERELDKYLCFPSYRDSFVSSGHVDYIEYDEMSIVCKEWHGDSCDVWRTPIFSEEQLESLQQVSFDIVSSINDMYHARRAKADDEATKARRAQYEELRKEFGDD